MRNFFKLLSVSICLLGAMNFCYAEEYKILVLPDSIQFDSTNYFVYPDASVMFASDTINALKQTDRVKTVSMGEIRDSFRKNQRLRLLSSHALKEYKYNYNVDFVDLKKIANTFSVDKVLLISSTTDVQNYVLRRTLWDFLNIPGAAVIDPAYKVSTHASLVDVEKEKVLWQQTYYKKLATVENRMIAVSFAPANEQLERINSYSSFLSLDIAQKVQSKILPQPVLTVEGNLIENIENPLIKPLPLNELNINHNPLVPVRSKLGNDSVRVNDL